jgi:hypothetical protein
MITLLNNRVKEVNQKCQYYFEWFRKQKYGTGYVHGYGYGNYANGYYEEERSKSGIKIGEKS